MKNKTLRFFGAVFVAGICILATVFLTLYGLHVSIDLRNQNDTFANEIGFAVFFASIIFFWATIWSIGWRFYHYLKRLLVDSQSK